MKNKIVYVFPLLFLKTGLLICSNNHQSPIAYVENKGQVHDQFNRARRDVLFSCENSGTTFHLKENSICYQLYGKVTYNENRDERLESNLSVQKELTVYRIDIKWLNSLKPLISVDEPLSETQNFYSSSTEGVIGVRSYAGITYKNLYRDVDLHYYSQNGRVKYDFIVAPGADYKQIALEIAGAQHIRINEGGAVIIQTPLGDLIEEAPVVIQAGKFLRSKWVLKNNILTFDIDDVDPHLSLLIDPVTRVWGTYYGSMNNPYIFHCTSDLQSNLVVFGVAGSGAISLATSGSHQTTAGGGGDGYVAKFNQAGQRLWATYYGGKGNESFKCGTTDVFGNIYAGGNGDSLTPLTPGCHQPIFGGHYTDGLIVKLNNNGVLQWSTLYGEGSSEYLRGISTDRAGNVFFCANIGGYQIPVSSGTAIATPGSYQSAFNGTYTCFLVKLNGQGQRQWATFYGNKEWGAAETCAADSAGNIYLIGRASDDSIDFIASAGAYQTQTGGGAGEGFIAKFNPSGTRLWGTYYGGGSDEYVFGGGCDAAGNVVIAGWMSYRIWDSIIKGTPGSIQPTPSGQGDAFITKFDPNGTRLWGTYYGGFGTDGLYGCHVDSSGVVTFVGTTNSTSKIATVGSHQFSLASNYQDAYVVELNKNGGLNWGTYYGGTSVDAGMSCVKTRNGNTYLTGYTHSIDSLSIATPGSFQSNYSTYPGGSHNDDQAFFVRFNDCNVNLPFSSTTPGSVVTGSCGFSPTLSVNWRQSVNWYTVPAGGTSIGTGYIYKPGSLPGGSYTFYAEGISNCSNIPPRVPVQVNIAPCVGFNENRLSTNNLCIYPNPVKDKIVIKDNFIDANSGTLTIYDSMGRLVFSDVMTEQINSSIDVSTLTRGIYFLHYQGEVRKIVKE